ncbi:MAG: CinA family protein [Micropruina sp.]|nr:MAG: CinA family protein [Micropruina sp.]
MRSLDELAKTVGKTMTARDLTLATSESLTGGLLGAVITSVPGSSAYYLGGAVAYATAMKARLSGVERGILATYGVVSEQTVTEMAMGIQVLTGADWAIAVSGVAGPDPQEGTPPVKCGSASSARGSARWIRPSSRTASSSTVTGRPSASRPSRPAWNCCWP